MSISDAGLVHVGNRRHLRWLSVKGLPISDVGLAPLQGLEHLEQLIISGTRITDAGLRHLEGTNIKSLDLCDTDISDAGLEHLAKMRKLEWLGLAQYEGHPRRAARVSSALARVSRGFPLASGQTNVTGESMRQPPSLRHMNNHARRRSQNMVWQYAESTTRTPKIHGERVFPWGQRTILCTSDRNSAHPCLPSA